LIIFRIGPGTAFSTDALGFSIVLLFCWPSAELSFADRVHSRLTDRLPRSTAADRSIKRPDRASELCRDEALIAELLQGRQ
jgi:hypothetical protein